LEQRAELCNPIKSIKKINIVQLHQKISLTFSKGFAFMTIFGYETSINSKLEQEKNVLLFEKKNKNYWKVKLFLMSSFT
jgi:hypothetical protein